MLTNEIEHLNGTNGIKSTVVYPACFSDYEPRPQIDITPRPEPKPAWRDQHAGFTHHIQWVDGDGISHGLTLRSDSLQDLMADLRLVKSMIKASKQQHSSANPEAKSEQPDTPDVKRCTIHNCDMPRRWSKRTNGHYFGHGLPDGSFCYGSQKK